MLNIRMNGFEVTWQERTSKDNFFNQAFATVLKWLLNDLKMGIKKSP